MNWFTGLALLPLLFCVAIPAGAGLVAWLGLRHR
jgi:hypothetical protein